MTQNDDPNLPPRQTRRNNLPPSLLATVILIALGTGAAFYNNMAPDTSPKPPVAATTRAPQQAYAGIGLQLAPGPQGPVVVRAWPGTPSAKSGLQKGDLIVAIDGAPTAGVSIADVTNLIKGAEGTTVTLTWSRNGGAEQKTSITRALIPPSVFQGSGK